MQEIQTKAMQKYAKNREFFSQKHPDIFHKLMLLEEAINNKQYKEKYALEYKEKYFDVVELSSGNFLYNSNSVKISEQLTAQVNLSKNSQIFEGFGMYLDYEKDKDNFDDKTEGSEGVFPLMSYYLKNTPKNPQFKEIEKFIFIGVGLGLHIPQIAKKIQAEEYFIIEDDLELFRLSLFTTPYYKLQGNLFFSIAEQKDRFTQNFKNFLELSFFRNRYLKYSYFPAHSKEKIAFIKNALALQAFSSFPYKTLLKKIMRSLGYISQNYSFINLAKHFKISDINQIPVLILGAGPSFSKNIEWVKAHQNKFIIVAVSAVLNKLSQEEIYPDIVTHLDGFNVSIKHLEGFNAEIFLQNAILLAGSFTPQAVIGKFSKKNVYIYEEDNTRYHDGFGSITGPCVGSTALLSLIQMNMKSIYTVGLDLALDKEGYSHSSSHILSNTTKYDLSQANENAISMRGMFFPVSGNFEKTVMTNPLFYSSIHALDSTLPLIKNDTQTIYNLSDGAAIKATEPTHIENIHIDKVLNKQDIHQKIIDLLEHYSARELTKEDLISLQSRKEFASHLNSSIKNFVNMKFTDANQFLYSFISLLLDILIEPTRDTNDLVTIYDRFLSYTAPIIFDFFNTKELTNIQEHVKKFQSLLTDEMFEIVKIYEKNIEEFLKKQIKRNKPLNH